MQNNILVSCTVFLSCTTLLVIILIDRITQVTRLRAEEAVLRQSLETQGKTWRPSVPPIPPSGR